MTTKAEVRVHIRWLIRRDMPEVLAIEHASFGYPWCEEEFLRQLRRREVIGMVAECGERVVGFMVYDLEKRLIRVQNFAVDPLFRRQCVGQQMAAKLVGKLSSHRRTLLAAGIRETNLPGLIFLRSQGFVATGTQREHYEDTGEDQIVMEYALDQSQWEGQR